MEPNYGGAVEAAHAALDKPKRFRDCVAVLLDKGGDSGYWMRLLGNANIDNRRVGSLMVTEDSVSYAEMCAYQPRPASTMAKLGMMARGGGKLFGFYVWTARRNDIDDLAVHPISHSPHGAFASVVVSAHGERMKFGIDLARPNPQAFVSALRHVAGSEHNLHEPPAGEPRTDGIYVFAADSRPERFNVVVFDHSRVALLRLVDVAKSIARLREGSWEPRWLDYRPEGDRFLIGTTDEYSFVQPDGRLVWSRDEPEYLGQNTSEFEFVAYAELAPGWGCRTIPAPLPTPEWAPVLTKTGEIVAPELGFPKARVKG